jgi:hypothetical protein
MDHSDPPCAVQWDGRSAPSRRRIVRGQVELLGDFAGGSKR